MSNVLSSIEGGAVGGATAIAVGAGLQPTIEPGKQEVWANNAYRVLEANILARLVAQGLVEFDPAAEQAKRTGFDANKFRGLVELAKAGPPIAEALELWRRDKITLEQMNHALAKAQIEPQYWEPIRELFVGRLDPAIIAVAIQRGIMHDPGFLPVGPPSGVGKVPAFPVSPLDPVQEAKAHGIDLDRLFVETAIVGLPMSLQEAASAFFRGIITIDDFNRAVSEGNTRNEWREFILEQARSILSPNQYAELQLRGFLDETQRREKTAQYGMHDGDSDLLYDLLGRSIPVHQITTGEARGGVYDGDFSHVPAPYLSSLRRGNLRPEFYNLAYANRYSYPSAFFFRLLLTTGAITAAEAEQAFLDIGWSPHWAKLVSTTLAASAPMKGDPHVAKAETQLWTTLHSSFVKRETNVTDARANMTTLGIPRNDQTIILNLWQAERDLVRKQLTPAQIKKAYLKASRNAATAAPWTHDEAIAALVSEGYSVQTANDYLDIP